MCNPEDLRTPGFVWTVVPNDQDGQGSYSFAGGSVTYNGATATYMTTADYRVNGGRDLSTTCENEMWTPTAVITPAGDECSLHVGYWKNSCNFLPLHTHSETSAFSIIPSPTHA